MDPHTIEFLLYCNWKDFPPAYRIYFDSDLLTERSYMLDNEYDVLQERLTVFSENTNPHVVTIEQVGVRTGQFRVDRIESDLKVDVVIK